MKQQRQKESPMIRLSKLCAFVLRHGAKEKGIAMRQDGYVLVDELLNLPDFRKLKVTRYSLEMMVKNNDKKRYELTEEMINGELVQFIRASQGHTIKDIDDEQLLRKIEDPNEFPYIVHGTTFDAWKLIKNTGLNSMARNHIHFATGLPGDDFVISGMRGSSQVIIEVDLKRALQDGIPFYVSKNGVVLSPGINKVIEPKYFKMVFDKNRNNLLLANQDQINDEFQQKKQKLQQFEQFPIKIQQEEPKIQQQQFQQQQNQQVQQNQQPHELQQNTLSDEQIQESYELKKSQIQQQEQILNQQQQLQEQQQK